MRPGIIGVKFFDTRITNFCSLPTSIFFGETIKKIKKQE